MIRQNAHFGRLDVRAHAVKRPITVGGVAVHPFRWASTRPYSVRSRCALRRTWIRAARAESAIR
jgi:hypothetical protein